MTDIETASQPWSRDAQKLGILLWIPFLTAAVMSVVFFALIDPLAIVDELSWTFAESREAGYALMFFFIWSTALASGWLCLRLARRKRNWPKPIGPQGASRG